MDIGKRIRRIRESKKLSQSEIEKRTGLKREYLSKIEIGDLKNPTYFTILKICRGMEVSITDLIEDDHYEEPLPTQSFSIVPGNSAVGNRMVNSLDADKYISIPILESSIAANNPSYVEEDFIEDFALVDKNCLEPSNDRNRYRCIWYHSFNKSMYPIITKKSLLCIDSYQRDPDSLENKIVALKDEEGDLIVRYLKLYKNNILGVPYNIEKYNPVVLSKKSKNPVIGRVVWYWSDLNS